MRLVCVYVKYINSTEQVCVSILRQVCVHVKCVNIMGQACAHLRQAFVLQSGFASVCIPGQVYIHAKCVNIRKIGQSMHVLRVYRVLIHYSP